jgi:Secretion system C-terminal sorting domain
MNYRRLAAAAGLLLIISHQLYSQCSNPITIPINLNCTKYQYTCSSNLEFQNTCNSASGWSPSNGNPQLVPQGSGYYAQMLAEQGEEIGSSIGEGMFIPFNLINGQSYILQVYFGIQGGESAGTVTFTAANGLVQTISACETATPSVSNQMTLGSVTNSSTSPYTSQSVTISGGNTNLGGGYTGYSQFWMYATFTPPNNGVFLGAVSGITICPVCNIGAPSGLGVTNAGTTLIWNPVPGAGYYNIYVTDVHNGEDFYSTLTSNDAEVNFCALGVSDNVSFTVQSFCPNAGAGGSSSTSEYVYSPQALSAPTKLSFSNVPPYTVSWYPVSGATYYYYQEAGSTPIPVSGTSISDPSAQLSYGTTYDVSVAAANSCTTGSYCTPMQVTLPSNNPSCSPAPTVSYVEGGTFVELYPVSGATSYNVGFENSSGILVWQIDDISTSITSSGYNCTGVPSGSYYIIAQANCGSEGSSNWGSPYYGGLQSVSRTVSPLDSARSRATFNNVQCDSTIAMTVYPNPSHSFVNIFYNTTQTGPADLTVTTEFGNSIIRKMVTTNSGQNTYMLDISQLASGIYFIRLTDGKNIRYQKLVIAK